MKAIYTVVLLAALLINPIRAELPSLTLLTEQYQPFNFIDPADKTNRVQGIAVDLMNEMLVMAGSDQTWQDIYLQPWTRGYITVQNDKNTVLFSTARTHEREDLFKWACPIAELKTELIALKSSRMKIASLSDLIKYQIGSIKHDVGEQLIHTAGVPSSSTQRTSTQESNIKKLQAGRIDLYVGSMASVASMCKSIGCDADLFQPVYTLDVSQLCFAFNKDTDDSIITQLQSALDELIAMGLLEELHMKYEKWK